MSPETGRRTVGGDGERSAQAMEKLVTALLVWPPNEHDTVAMPPVPDDCRCQVHPTTPLLPTVCADPSNDCGACPVEYTTRAVQTAPAALLAYSVG